MQANMCVNKAVYFMKLFQEVLFYNPAKPDRSVLIPTIMFQGKKKIAGLFYAYFTYLVCVFVLGFMVYDRPHLYSLTV